jgi:hypothetical protein
MLNLSIQCSSFERNHSSCTGRSSENLCSRRSGKIERQGETQETIKIDGILMVSWVLPPPPLNANVLFLQGVFESHPVYDQTQGIGGVFS